MTDHDAKAREIFWTDAGSTGMPVAVVTRPQWEDALRSAAEEEREACSEIVYQRIKGIVGTPDTEVNRAFLRELCNIEATIRARGTKTGP